MYGPLRKSLLYRLLRHFPISSCIITYLYSVFPKSSNLLSVFRRYIQFTFTVIYTHLKYQRWIRSKHVIHKKTMWLEMQINVFKSLQNCWKFLDTPFRVRFIGCIWMGNQTGMYIHPTHCKNHIPTAVILDVDPRFEMSTKLFLSFYCIKDSANPE